MSNETKIPTDILKIIRVMLDESADNYGNRTCEDQEEEMKKVVRALSPESKELLRTSFQNVCHGWEETEDDDFGHEQTSTLAFALWDIVCSRLVYVAK